MNRAVPVLLTVLGIMASLVPPAAAALPAERAAAAQGRYQSHAIAATNRHRSQHDRAALRKQACVQRFAVRQASRMARQERMYHQGLEPILRQCGLSTVGENVAYGYPSGRSVVDDGWMRSEGHRANILNRRFKLVGIGARQSDDGTWYAAQVFGRKR